MKLKSLLVKQPLKKEKKSIKENKNLYIGKEINDFISRSDITSGYNPKVKFQSNESETKWLDIDWKLVSDLADTIQDLNEDISYADVDSAMESVSMFNAEEMEEFFKKLFLYFKENAEFLHNMDAEGISQDIKNAYAKIANRKGN